MEEALQRKDDEEEENLRNKRGNTRNEDKTSAKSTRKSSIKR